MNERTAPSMLDRTLDRLQAAWRDIAASARGVVPAVLRTEPFSEGAERLRKEIQACLDAGGGEVSARARAAELGRTYLSLSDAGRARFLRVLAEHFDPDRARVDAAIAAVRAAGAPWERRTAERTLRAALDAPRVKLLTRFNALPQGVKFLVDMRALVLRLLAKDAALAPLEADLKALLASWFDIGFLELQRITWNSPAALLEKLAAYEAVHEIRSWQDLKDRLDSDRRCFAFFHPNMPEEPLIFVEVALVDGMAGNIQALLDERAPAVDPRDADTAIFYSISSAQEGLAGISFGGFLIKRVVEQLSMEFKGLKTFATLSPIPGFLTWLDERLTLGKGNGVLLPSELKALRAAPRPIGDESALAATLADARWHEDEPQARALGRPLMRLCAHYLLEARRPGGQALDPVAHFHLSNGARVERLNWLADGSAKGLRASAGLMVNFLYRESDIEVNHEAYTASGKIAASSSVRGLIG